MGNSNIPFCLYIVENYSTINERKSISKVIQTKAFQVLDTMRPKGRQKNSENALLTTIRKVSYFSHTIRVYLSL